MQVTTRTIALALLLCFVLKPPPPADAVIEDVLDVIHVVKEVTTGILKAWDIVQQTPLVSSIEFPLMREKQKKVLQRLKEVGRHIDQTEEKHANNVALAIESINAFIANNQPLVSKMNDVTNTMNSITSRFEKMLQYETYKDKLEMSTLLTFAEWTVSPNAYSVHFLMDRLHLTLFGHEDKANISTNMFAQLAENYETSTEQICHTQQSTQQFVYSLYADIALTELKGYAMMEFSWMILRIYGKGNFTQEAELMRQDYDKRTERTLKLLREIMRRSDRILWRCDPNKFIKGQNYEEVTRLLQGYIENEVDLNSDETCRETCSFYQATRSDSCFKDKFCARQPKCRGRLYHCTFVDSDMSVCQSPQNSSRRYEYIQYENGRVLGKRGPCARGTTAVDSWWRYLFWHCSYCFCLCDEQGLKSDRYFNLRESVTDVKNNYVVTGLQIVKHNRIFHLQIQQGQLLPRAAVNASTIAWLPVADYKIYDRNVRNGEDFYTLSFENRSIDLDDINTDDQTFVVTGVRFRVLGAHLNLEAKLCEFDFETGVLISPEINCFWKSNDNTDVSGERRQKITLQNPDVSTESKVKSIPSSRHNQYIDFVNTSLDKDAAQSTVPFIDIQEVISHPPVPLSGIGLYHKGRAGFGGFLAPKIITYDFTPHVRMPKSIK